MGSADALLIERVRSYLPHLPEPNPYGSLLYLPWLRSRKAVRVTITVAPVSATMASHRSVTPSRVRSEEHTSELQSLMRISYAVFCLKKKTQKKSTQNTQQILQNH